MFACPAAGSDSGTAPAAAGGGVDSDDGGGSGSRKQDAGGGSGTAVLLAVGTQGGLVWLWSLPLPAAYTLQQAAPRPAAKLVRCSFSSLCQASWHSLHLLQIGGIWGVPFPASCQKL